VAFKTNRLEVLQEETASANLARETARTTSPDIRAHRASANTSFVEPIPKAGADPLCFPLQMGGGGSSTTTQTVQVDSAGRGDRVCLLVFADDKWATYALPSTGTLTVGRDAECEIRLNAPWISRRHALLHLGPALRIEDLGGTNGTRVLGAQLPPHTATSFRFGDVIEFGNTQAVVQRYTFGLQASSDSDKEPHSRVVEPMMRRIHQLAKLVAKGTINVLLLGETGVGKEVMAETIHRFSPRAGMPFLCLNCTAFTETLLESELFGHERGAFTGAVRTKAGLLETANGGTVFLDEVGDMPLAIQAKLLRVIEQREMLRVGGLSSHSIDVRFISATNRDLDRDVDDGRFRRDLFFRLNGVALVIPPLRERRDEIALLAQEFLRETCKREGRIHDIALASDVIEVLERYSWPGNIRELRNVVERAVLLCPSDTIGLQHLPEAIVRPSSMRSIAATDSSQAPGAGAEGEAPTAVTLRDAVEEIERNRITEALESCAHNQTRAAQLLGISRSKLIARMEAFGFKRPRKP